MHQVVGVWNLSADQGNLGTLYVTNVRVVWFANLAENFNVSIPHIQVVTALWWCSCIWINVIQKSVRVRESKFGLALVIDTLPQSGGYILGFKIEPKEILYEIAKEIQNVHDMFLKNPVLGVPFSGFEEVLEITTALAWPSTQNNPFAKGSFITEELDAGPSEEDTDAVALYYADSGKAVDEPVFSPELGLAIEKLKDGLSIESLWRLK